jgi:hypothetical protein
MPLIDETPIMLLPDILSGHNEPVLILEYGATDVEI